MTYWQRVYFAKRQLNPAYCSLIGLHTCQSCTLAVEGATPDFAHRVTRERSREREKDEIQKEGEKTRNAGLTLA